MLDYDAIALGQATLNLQFFRSTTLESRQSLKEHWGTTPSIAWNEVTLDSISKYRLNPLRAARVLAHLHAALHDALQLCRQKNGAPRCAEVAQHVAAGRTLEHFFPEEAAGRYMALAVSALASLDWLESSAEDQTAMRVGTMVADAAIKRACSDGSDRPLTAPQRPAPKPGTWRPTPPLYALNALEGTAPHWKTWFLRSSNEVVPPPPLPYGSAAYVSEVREVLEVSQMLTDAQRRIVDDWNLDIGTATPPGVWNRHAARWLRAANADLVSATRVLTELNLTMFDALVACWNAKLQYWTERPVTEVRERFDAQFIPYISTPPFPGYVSGHATVSAAAAEVIGGRLPDVREEASAMAAEAALSRLYGGIHLRSDNVQGLSLGSAIGRLAVERFDAIIASAGQSTKR